MAEVLAEVESRFGVVRPLRVHFDTAQYQDLSALPPSDSRRRAFVLASQRGLMRPVLSTLLCIEFAKKPPHFRERISELLEVLVAEKLVVWVRPTDNLCRREWRRTAEHDGDGILPEAEVFVNDWVDALECEMALEGEMLREESFAQLLEGWAMTLPEAYWNESLGLTLAAEHQQRQRGLLPRERKRYTRVEIISRMLATLPADLISSGKIAALRGNAVSFDRMPANRIMVAWEEGNEVGRVPRRETDAEDLYHLGSAVYCDIAFVDKQTHERLVIAGHCPAHVRRNSECSKLIEWLATRIDTGTP